MALYVILCIDKPNASEVRLANRAAHLDYLKAQGERLLMAGPLLSDDGEAMQGSLLVFEFDDQAQAEAFLADEPYAKAGLFDSVTLRRYRKVLP